jgi:hypothetical protein
MTGISTRGTPQRVASGNAAPAWPVVAGGVIWIGRSVASSALQLAEQLHQRSG